MVRGGVKGTDVRSTFPVSTRPVKKSTSTPLKYNGFVYGHWSFMTGGEKAKGFQVCLMIGAFRLFPNEKDA